MHEDAMEFDDPFASVRALTQLELKIAERVTAYSAGDMDMVAHIEEHDEESRRWKAHHGNVHKYRESVSKAAFQMTEILLKPLSSLST